MDKQSIIGLVLIAGVLVGWSLWTKPSPEQLERAAQYRDSVARAEKARAIEEAQLAQANAAVAAIGAAAAPDTARDAGLGAFNAAHQGQQQTITLENDQLALAISTRGGRPYTVTLKEFQTFDSLPLNVFDGDSTLFGYTFLARGARQPINTNNLFWRQHSLQRTDTATVLAMRLEANAGSYLQYTYTLPHQGYDVRLEVNAVGLDDVIQSNYMTFNWSYMVPHTERSLKWERQKTTMYYRYTGSDTDYLSETTDDSKKLEEKVDWVGFKSHFFSTIIESDEKFADLRLSSSTTSSLDHVKSLSLNAFVPYTGDDNQQLGYTLHFVPNKFKTLKAYDRDFEKMIPLGWGIFRWVNQYLIINIFNLLSRFIESYGLIILLMTLIIKLLLFPLTYKSYMSTAKMSVLKPEIEEINQKYPNSEDAMKKQQAVMALYKKAGISTMGGCLPTLLQMPILIAMFTFFPSSFELRQQSFLWATDLSSYDSILNLPFSIPFYGSHVSLFCLLMTITNILYIRVGNQANANSSMPGMKTMMYMMPIMMLFIFNDYASGLSYYYFISLLITILQTVAIRRFVDEDAIRAQIKANKAKPVKKSNFQKRLEEAARQSQQQRRR